MNQVGAILLAQYLQCATDVRQGFAHRTATGLANGDSLIIEIKRTSGRWLIITDALVYSSKGSAGTIEAFQFNISAGSLNNAIPPFLTVPALPINSPKADNQMTSVFENINVILDPGENPVRISVKNISGVAANLALYVRGFLVASLPNQLATWKMTDLTQEV
jgi:hypothetical protein